MGTPNKELARRLRAADYFTLGFGACVGTGWIILMGEWLYFAQGPVAAAAGFGLAFLLMLPLAYCYAELAPMFERSGGAIVYVQKAFGRPVLTFTVAWFMLLAYGVLCPWETIAIGSLTSEALSAGVAGATDSAVAAHGVQIALGCLLALIVAAANYFGSQLMAALQKYLTYLLILTGLAVVVGGFGDGSLAAALHVGTPGGEGWGQSVARGTLWMASLAPFFLAGFETVAQGSEERGAIPAARLGKTLVLALMSAALFYVLVCFALGASLPDAAYRASEAPKILQTLRSALHGEALARVAAIGALAGLVTTFNSFFYGTARVLLGMGRAGFLPSALARVHPRYGTPHIAILVCLVLSVAGPFFGRAWLVPFATIGGIGFVVVYLGGAMAARRLRKTCPDLERPYKMPGGAGMAALGVVTSSVLLALCLVPGLGNALGWPLDYEILGGWCVLGAATWLVYGRRRHTSADRTT
jgi:amino acid transporter